jgi:hypothetical protein
VSAGGKCKHGYSRKGGKEEGLTWKLHEELDVEPEGDRNWDEIDEDLGTSAVWVQHKDDRVLRPEGRRELPPNERGSVESMPDDSGQRPREHHAGVEWATSVLFVSSGDKGLDRVFFFCFMEGKGNVPGDHVRR